MESARVAEDERALGRCKCDRPAIDAVGELVLRRIVVAERAPGPERVQLSARRTPRHVFEGPGLLVDVDEVEERLEQVAIVEVTVPALRRLAVLDARRRCVPDVDVLELRPEAEIGVREVEQPRINTEPQPGVPEPELHAVRVLADDKLLARPPAQCRVAAAVLPLEPGLRLRAEARRVGLELA